MNKQRAITLLCQMYLPHFNDEEKEALSMGIEALEQTKNDGWISIKDELPPKPTFEEKGYIVQKEDVIEPFSAYWNGATWTDINDDVEDGVIAWMELPEQYRE
jgi:hypothetical protein